MKGIKAFVLAMTVFASFIYVGVCQSAFAGYPGSGFETTDQGIKYRMSDGSYLSSSWLTIGSQKWAFDGNGLLLTGNHMIDGETWTLSLEGLAIQQDASGLDDIPIAIQADNAIATQEAASGIVNTDSAMYNLCLSTLIGCTTADMTQDQKLKAAYDYVVNSTTYERTYETPSGDWTAAYATELLTTGKGNCYRFAAAFAYLAKALGYDSRVITGQIGAARGGLTPHGWVEIIMGGQTYIFDPEMQYAKKGAKDYYFKTYETYPSNPLVKAAEWPVIF